MKIRKKMIAAVIPLVCLAIFAHSHTAYAANTKQVTLYMTGLRECRAYPAALDKARKISVKSSNKAVAQAKYKKSKRQKYVLIKARKAGKATVTVKYTLKNKKTKTCKYKVKVKKAPEGCSKAVQATFTVTESGAREVVLTG